MKNKFIQCGFEFTAAKKLGKFTSDHLDISSWGGDMLERKTYSTPISPIKWIDKSIESDDCGIEIPSPIIECEEEAILVFKQFK